MYFSERFKKKGLGYNLIKFSGEYPFKLPSDLYINAAGRILN